MKIYISGKISGLEKSEYENNFADARVDLLKTYNLWFSDIINPINIKPFLGIKSWLCYMINDVRQLRKCSHIYMQNNWIQSKGAVIEFLLAKFIFKHEVIFQANIYEECLEFSIKKGWTNPITQIQKVHSEVIEVFNAETKEQLADEIGDMLFAMNPLIFDHLGTTTEALIQRALEKNKIRETNPNYKR